MKPSRTSTSFRSFWKLCFLEITTIVSTLDAKDGYWEVEVEGSETDKAAFSGHFCLLPSFCIASDLMKVSQASGKTMYQTIYTTREQIVLYMFEHTVIFLKT